MSLTAEDVREIMRLLEDSEFDTLDLETEDFKLTLRRTAAGVVEAESPLPLAGGGRRAGGDAPGASTDQTPPRPAAPPPQAGRKSAPGAGNIVDVPAPLLGVFYRAPKPGAPPFVEVGQRVEPDTVIAIIEVMKLMNSVRAGVSGEVVEVVAQNAAMVEHGEALIRVRTKQ